ncbi:hypothetical protein CBR_g31110 [Chara braunii]|uniref:Uncharacterized protein n=1 Tax=Chara braunii TaxID=69332 RepID=A0A388LEB4_CHABU|nr:hypothetical protein CBR_g31110 [Chara braunii]|eukprot:GBG80650.1 hypothetical protein CBR_g31110 [Chara braunii]
MSATSSRTAFRSNSLSKSSFSTKFLTSGYDRGCNNAVLAPDPNEADDEAEILEKDGDAILATTKVGNDRAARARATAIPEEDGYGDDASERDDSDDDAYDAHDRGWGRIHCELKMCVVDGGESADSISVNPTDTAEASVPPKHRHLLFEGYSPHPPRPLPRSQFIVRMGVSDDLSGFDDQWSTAIDDMPDVQKRQQQQQEEGEAQQEEEEGEAQRQEMGQAQQQQQEKGQAQQQHQQEEEEEEAESLASHSRDYYDSFMLTSKRKKPGLAKADRKRKTGPFSRAVSSSSVSSLSAIQHDIAPTYQTGEHRDDAHVLGRADGNSMGKYHRRRQRLSVKGRPPPAHRLLAGSQNEKSTIGNKSSTSTLPTMKCGKKIVVTLVVPSGQFY